MPPDRPPDVRPPDVRPLLPHYAPSHRRQRPGSLLLHPLLHPLVESVQNASLPTHLLHIRGVATALGCPQKFDAHPLRKGSTKTRGLASWRLKPRLDGGSRRREVG